MSLHSPQATKHQQKMVFRGLNQDDPVRDNQPSGEPGASTAKRLRLKDSQQSSSGSSAVGRPAGRPTGSLWSFYTKSAAKQSKSHVTFNGGVLTNAAGCERDFLQMGLQIDTPSRVTVTHTKLCNRLGWAGRLQATAQQRLKSP